MRITHLYLSPGHNYFGHHGRVAGSHPLVECSELHLVAGRGIEGDRFLDYKENYIGQITFFAGEVYETLCEQLLVEDKSPGVFRRNVITRAVDLNSLIATEFEVQGVRFRGMEEARPCYWMDEAFAPGAKEFLRGNGGLRAQILSDGQLRVTAAALALR